MSRPASVTAAAVVAFLGCAMTLLMGAGMAAVTLTNVTPTPVPRQLGIGMGVMFTALAALGITTGVALLRMREWARIAMLIFAGAMVVFSGFGALIIVLTPLPPTIPVGGEFAARAGISAVYAVPFAIGAWWLILFTRRGIVAAFAQPGAAGAPSPRPLMVTIIAYWIIVGGVGTILMSAIGMPAIFVGFVVQGWRAAVVYLALGALNLYAGWGLLKLQERARRLTIALFGLGVVQAIVVGVSPAVRQRMFAAQQAMTARVQAPGPQPFDAMQMGLWFMGAAAVIAAAAMWLLVRARPAFESREQSQSQP